MRVSPFLSFLALAGWAAARSAQHVGKTLPERSLPKFPRPEQPKYAKRQSYNISPPTAATSKYVVNGSNIPDVNFDIGESYALRRDTLRIKLAHATLTENKLNKPNETQQLYFWFFPSANPAAGDEITIWLNGGPGCSSLEGLLQENGPFLWQYGTFAPVPNPYTWVNLTNMVWVEQPVGTGFSQGTPTATNEDEVAAQFLGFWKNFVETFCLHNRKVYITGESYAGYYVPYIANAMLNANDTMYYNLDSIMIYDPSSSYNVVQQQIPVLAYVEYWSGLFNLNQTFMADITQRSAACGYTSFMEEYLVFPPPGQMPNPPNQSAPGCDLWDDIFNAALLTNPCFDIYQIATTCPVLWDVLGFPGSFYYTPAGATVYFNRTDVQMAINAPIQPWGECSNGVLNTDTSLPSGLSVLPSVIERTKRTIISHAALDYILLPNGTLLMIQNMTWNGVQGFTTPPADPFFVPYHVDYALGTLAASGIMGVTHTERGLTWVETWLSGHMQPQYQPSAAYRHLEFLLGRISSLSEVSDFTTQSGDFGNSNLNISMANYSYYEGSPRMGNHMGRF